MNKLPCILQISPSEGPDGATKVVMDLHHSYRSRGYPSYMAVGRKDRNDDNVFLIPTPKPVSVWGRFWKHIENQLIALHHSNSAKIPAKLALIKRSILKEFGIEDFDFPGTYDVLNLPPEKPDIVHAHNLHLDYFDLRALPWLSRQVPFVISMHDAWLLSGHCAHAIGCERWMTGCGKCPDLQIYPSMKRDATAYNWRRKKQIYADSYLYIDTPSQWLKKKVEQSMLCPAVVENRVIPYGVDLTVFKPRKKSEVRAALNIPQDKAVVLLRAKSLKTKNNYWLDFQGAKMIVDALTAQPNIPMTIIALGDDRPDEYFGQSEIRYIPYQKDHHTLAQYYQAADVFFHPARADNFPLVVLEALACGTPVVATQVCGIPEQIVDGVTGFLTPAGDVKSMIDRILQLLSAPELCSQMGQNAARDASQRFDHERHVNDYLNWYQEILESRARLKNG
jgi:glycosyltransferase involved in cell wall biosynthesis